MLDKKEFRKLIKKLNKEKVNENFDIEDQIILEKLKQNPFFKKANTVLLYYPIKNEVNVLPLIDYCLDMNKKVALPKTYKEKIEFYTIDKNWKENLIEGPFNTFEPQNSNLINSFDSTCVVIVPSMALARDKSRLGHGKGYYDKFLSKHIKLIKIGICRKHLLFETLPINANDVTLDEVISSN